MLPRTPSGGERSGNPERPWNRRAALPASRVWNAVSQAVGSMTALPLSWPRPESLLRKDSKPTCAEPPRTQGGRQRLPPRRQAGGAAEQTASLGEDPRPSGCVQGVEGSRTGEEGRSLPLSHASITGRIRGTGAGRAEQSRGGTTGAARPWPAAGQAPERLLWFWGGLQGREGWLPKALSAFYLLTTRRS